MLERPAEKASSSSSYSSDSASSNGGGGGDSARIEWRLTGTCGAAPVDITVTSVIGMNLLTGRILSHRCADSAAGADHRRAGRQAGSPVGHGHTGPLVSLLQAGCGRGDTEPLVRPLPSSPCCCLRDTYDLSRMATAASVVVNASRASWAAKQASMDAQVGSMLDTRAVLVSEHWGHICTAYLCLYISSIMTDCDIS